MTAKHVILISIDNLRFDCVGYQPDKRVLAKYDVLKYLETPTLDRIAERSLCFTQCTSTNTYTTAAHASMLTGLYPPRHGVRGFYDKKLSPDVFTIAEILKVYGYGTVMMTDTENLFVPVELNRGFDHFFHIDDEGLLGFLSQSRGRNLFVFAHLYDVHEPFLLSKHPKYVTDEYVATVESLYRRFNLAMETVGERDFKTYRRLWMRLLDRIGFKSHELFFPLYVQGVSRFDQGRLRAFMDGIESLGLLDDALMVVVSDHGGLHRTRAQADGMRVALELASAVRHQYAHQAHTIIIGDASHLRFYAEAERRDLEQAGQVRRHVERPDELAWVDDIEKAPAELDEIFRRRIVPAVLRGERAHVQAEHARAQLVVTRIQERTDRLVERFERAIGDMQAHVNAVEHRTVRWTLAFVLAAPLIAAGVGWYLVRSVGGGPRRTARTRRDKPGR